MTDKPKPRVTGQLILGVDGGGTKTVAAAARIDEDQITILAQATSGPSNPLSVGRQAAQQSITAAVNRLLQQLSSIHPARFASTCLAIAGTARAEERLALQQWAQQQPWTAQVQVVPDIHAVLAAPAETESPTHHTDSDSGVPWGIAVIAGTGSMAWGRCPNQSRNDDTPAQARCGGWGYLIGDEGSAYWIAAQALRAFGHMRDGRAPEDACLGQALCEATKCDDWPHIIQWLYRDDAPRTRIASLTRHLLAHTDASTTLRKIVHTAATDLANQALRVAEQLQLDAYPLKATGSLIVHGTPFRNEVFRLLRSASHPPSTITLVEHPVQGALHLAQRGRGSFPPKGDGGLF